jgi:hypothetical protein
MTSLIFDVEPGAAGTPVEFVAQLRRVRERSGLSYRQLAQRAEAAGHILPPSTLATMLSRFTLPREELVVALLTAVGGGPETIEAWLSVRQRLAWTELEAPAAGPTRTPEPIDSAPEGMSDPIASAPERTPDRSNPIPPQTTSPDGSASSRTADAVDPAPNRTAGPAGRIRLSRRNTLALLAAGALVAVVAAAVAVASGIGGRDTPDHRPALPQLGAYQIRLAHSNLCLSERTSNGNGELYQAPCPDAIPDMSLVSIVDGVYQVRTDHPEFGPGCMGVESAQPGVGAPLGDDFCTQPDAHDFRLEPVTVPVPGFRLRAVHSGLCAGIPSAATAQWQPVLQLSCDPENHGQVFVFDPR